MLTFIWAAWTLAALAAQPVPATEESLLAPDARLEKVFSKGFFTEGPAAAPDGAIYFSDITYIPQGGKREAGRIWRYDPKTGRSTIFRSPSGMSNGITFDAQGRMVVAEGAAFGGRRITRTDMKTAKSEMLAGLYQGHPFNSPNDLSIDEKGRIYFTDPRYLGHETVDQPVMGVYRIDPDGSVHLIIADAGKPNGIAISPDQKSLYLVSHDNGTLDFTRLPEGIEALPGRMALLAYDLAPDGSVTFRKTLVDYSPGTGPDGMAVDVEGNLYVTLPDERNPAIRVYSPEGKEVGSIQIPEPPANVAFGRGKESKTLYITARKSLYRIKVRKEGYQLPVQ